MKQLLNGQVIEDGVRHVKQAWSDMTGAGGNPGNAQKTALPVEYQPPPVQHSYPVQHAPYHYPQNAPAQLYGPGGNLIVYNPHDTAEQDMADNASEAQRVQWVKEVEISPLIHWMVTALACLGGWLAICLVFGFGGLGSFLLLAALGGSIPLSRRLYNQKIRAIVNSKHSREIYYTWRTRSEAQAEDERTAHVVHPRDAGICWDDFCDYRGSPHGGHDHLRAARRYRMDAVRALTATATL